MCIFSSGRAGRPLPDAAVCQGRNVRTGEVVITKQHVINKNNRMVYCPTQTYMSTMCRYLWCSWRSSSGTKDGGLTIATRHKLTAWSRSVWADGAAPRLLPSPGNLPFSHGQPGLYGDGEGGRFSRVGCPDERTAGGGVIRNA